MWSAKREKWLQFSVGSWFGSEIGALILRAFPTRATRLSSLVFRLSSESSEREISKLSNWGTRAAKLH